MESRVSLYCNSSTPEPEPPKGAGYRLDAVGRSEVRIGVKTAADTCFGVPCAIGIGALAVDFDGVTGPRLLLGARVRLELRLPGAEASIVTGARVAGRAVGATRFRYLFDLDRRPGEDIPSLVEAALELGREPGIAFERGLRASVNAPTGPLTAEVRGLSPAGIVIHVAGPHDRDLVVGDKVAVTVDIEGAFTVTGRVVRLEPVPEGVRVGVGFVPTDVDPLTRAVIERYLAGLVRLPPVG